MSEDKNISKRAQEILSGKDFKRVETGSLLSRLKAKDSKEIILVDLSGSMSDAVNHHESKYSIVKDVLRSLEGRRIFYFHSNVHELEMGKEIPIPGGGTNMAVAFHAMHQIKAEHVILITDGMPDYGTEEATLQAAKELKIEIIYVGPDPAPEFLARLAKILGTKFENLNLLKEENRRALRSKVVAFLKEKN